MDSEGFEIFERKDEELKEAENRLEKRKSENKTLTKEEIEERKIKIQKRSEIVRFVLLSLILAVSSVTMFFSIKIYSLYTSGGEQNIVFLNDVMNSNMNGGSDIIVQSGGESVVTTQSVTQQTHITVVTQPEGANGNQSLPGEQSGNTVSNNVTQSQQQQEITTAATTAAQENDVSLEKININTATLDQLMTLPGIGEVKAQAIITYRNENGNFYSVDDLVLVNGIGEKTVEKLRPYATVG